MFPSHPTTGSARTMGLDHYEQSAKTHSRVIRPARRYSIFRPTPPTSLAHRPVSFWKLRDDDGPSVWVVFGTHEEAAAPLAMSGANLSIATALDLLSNLDKLQAVHRTILSPQAPPAMDDYAYGCTLSSNPHNPAMQATYSGRATGSVPSHCPRPASQAVVQPPFLPPHQAVQSPRFVAAAVPGIPSPLPLAAAMQLVSQKGQLLLTGFAA
ncbi:hypothetical protein AURDEDRAFT_176973 [Auricularia subglabra TFB-10046 SS5]|uniref:Uncharacterized protein n=1 Tax=Auricularia subglabra (strain TFB-10046 / SS5) TaxID=717982 RepID=J0LBZ4_AURST|nr:hypothetical protein AURDEDRAFT_176973 [Auricularia subglabra TFB-10046 SS5]